MDCREITRCRAGFTLSQLLAVVALLAAAMAIVVAIKRESNRKEVIIFRLAFTHGDRHVIAKLSDGSLRGWQIVDGKQVVSLPAPPHSDVVDIAFSPDGETVARVWVDQRVQSQIPLYQLDVHELTTGKLLSHRKMNYLKGLAFSPDGKQLALVNSRDNQLLLVDPFDSVKPPTIVGELDASRLPRHDYVRAMDFGPQYLYVIGIHNENPFELAKWDIATGKVDRSPLAHRGEGLDPADLLAVSADGLYIASFRLHPLPRLESSIELFDANTLAHLVRVSTSPRPGLGIGQQGLEFVESGKSLAVLNYGLDIYDVETLKLKKRVDLDESRAMAASRDGWLLAIAGEKSIKLYDGNQLRNFVTLREPRTGLVPLTIGAGCVMAILIALRRRKKMRARTK
jgi:WD40 repeat protein